MGLGTNVFRLLCEARAQGVVFDDTLTIGRQNSWSSLPQLLPYFHTFGLNPTEEQLASLTGSVYAEPMFSCLGANRVDSVDNSDYESSTMIWDMNRPIPKEWHEKYDFVYDGGSIEHVFNVPQVVANYMNLVKVGGHIAIVTMANNFCGHGFYQFSPEFFYRAFAPENGFNVERLAMYEYYSNSPCYEVPDPAKVRSRIELSNDWIGTNIFALMKRTAPVKPFDKWPQQSDYTALWDDSKLSAPAPAARPRPSAKRRLIAKAKRAFPRLVELKHSLLYDYPWLTKQFHRWKSLGYHKTHSFTAQSDRFIPSTTRHKKDPATGPAHQG